MTSFSAQREGVWAMMTDDDERGVKIADFLMTSFVNDP